MQQEQLLRGVISSKELSLGATPAGADWCIKALHPSDPSTQVKGIPDMSAATSLCMNYQTTYTLSPTPGAVGTWSFTSTMLPHPIDFMAIQYTDSVGDHTANVLNSQIPGEDMLVRSQWLASNAQQWRLAYAGVTVTQDGPDLANQGTIVVAQAPVEAYRVSACAWNNGDDKAMVSVPAVEVYGAEDLPDFNTSQAMPNAYFEQSKRGAYVPLKLTRMCQRWAGQSSMVGAGLQWDASTGGYRYPTAETFSWPHWTLPCTRWTSVADASGVWYAPMTSPMLNDVFAHISAKNLAVTTSFTMFFRYGIEMRVAPSSSLSPQLELAPRHDERALYSYYAISRELKDAYEARYNELGKLWGVISNVADQILPIIGKIGPGGKAVQTIGTGLVQAGNVVQQQVTRRRQRKRKPKTTTPSKGPPPLPARSGSKR